MNHDEVYELLIEYAEGRLDNSRKQLIEEELKKSAALRDELSLLRSTFETLQHDIEEDVPDHYFTNFLPRLREKVERKKKSAAFLLPSWIQKMASPIAAVTIIAAMIGLYDVLMPENSEQIIYSLVQSADQGDLERFIANDSPFGAASEFLSSSAALNPQIFSNEFIASSTLYDNAVYDAQILSQLDDQDVEWIVQQLSSNSVQ